MRNSIELIDIPGTPYCCEVGQREQIGEIVDRVRDFRTSGPLKPDVLYRIRQFFKIKNIHNSNAIEGNVLDHGETRQVVEYGLTLTGKPLKDQAEAKNLSHALDYLEELAANIEQPITETDVRTLHGIVLKDIDDSNAGRYRSVQVEISGSEFKPPNPESVPGKMAEFGEWLKEASVESPREPTVEGLLNAAVAHTWFVYIHPFVDGNGRVGRMLMNLLLMRSTFPIAIITREDRMRYYDALEVSQGSDLSPFLSLLSETLLEGVEEYEDAVKEQREHEEWAVSVANKLETKERIRAENEYEIWKNAMELLRSYFRYTAEMIDESTPVAKIYFKDFGDLPFEKYLSLRGGESAKRTWFFRVDFVRGNDSARYLFFFGLPSPLLRNECEVAIQIAREEPAGSYYYVQLWRINAPNRPNLTEIGYQVHEERFVARGFDNRKRYDKIEHIGRQFFEEVAQRQLEHRL